jgi:hypothetical protein
MFQTWRSYAGRMPISDRQLQEFIDLYEQECGERLPPEEARAMLLRLVELYVRLAEPLPGEASDEPEAHGRSPP